MKTDKYKDWEYKFFEGEELTPEEELFLKNESPNPYFSFLKEEKQDKLDLSFEDFLSKVEEPKQEETKVVVLPRKSFAQKYWMAASIVLMTGVGAFWMLDNPETVSPPLAKHQSVPKPVVEPQVSRTEDHTPIALETSNQNQNVINNEEVKRPVVSKVVEKQYIARHHAEIEKQPTKSMIDTQFKDESMVYNPNYVLINGKPVYSEEEAIAIAEDTFNYFASNVTHTISQAESAQTVSKDLYQIINY